MASAQTTRPRSGLICPEGKPFVFGFLGVFILASWFWQYAIADAVMGVSFLGCLFCTYFFRDPSRDIPLDDHLVVSPADGKITEIVSVSDPAWSEPVWVIRIFLSVFDVHLQRTPVAGTVRKITYTPGKFYDARDPKAYVENEQNRIEIEPSTKLFKGPIVVTQIAGLIARRIVCDVKRGENIPTGHRLGLIRFGSQVNLVLPKTLTLCVKAGDRVKTGSTVVAKAT